MANMDTNAPANCVRNCSRDEGHSATRGQARIQRGWRPLLMVRTLSAEFSVKWLMSASDCSPLQQSTLIAEARRGYSMLLFLCVRGDCVDTRVSRRLVSVLLICWDYPMYGEGFSAEKCLGLMCCG